MSALPTVHAARLARRFPIKMPQISILMAGYLFAAFLSHIYTKKDTTLSYPQQMEVFRRRLLIAARKNTGMYFATLLNRTLVCGFRLLPPIPH